MSTSQRATERSASEERERRDLETTRLLLEAAGALNAWTDLEALLAGLAEVVLRAVPHSRVTIGLLSEDGSHLTLVAGAGESLLEPGTSVPLEGLSAGLLDVLAKGRTRIVDYDELPEERRGVAGKRGGRLALVVPLKYRDRVLGDIGIDDPGERRSFDDREIEVVEGIASQAASAIENARLFEAECVRRQRLEALQDVSLIATSSLDVGQVSDRTARYVSEHLGVDVVTVWAFDPDHRRLVPVSGVGFPPAFFADFAGGVGLDDPFVVSMAYKQGETFRFEGAKMSDVPPRVLASYTKYGRPIKALLVLPVADRPRPFGAITLAWCEPRRLDEDDVEFFSSVAHLLASSSENARLYEIEARSARLGQVLNELNDEIASTLESDEILRRTVERGRKALGSDGCVIERHQDGQWEVTFAAGLDADVIGKPLVRGAAVARIAAERRGVLVLEDIAADPTLAWVAREHGIKSLVAVPLVVRGSVIGIVIFVQRSGARRYAQAEIDFAQRLAVAVSLALENSRLYEVEHRVAQTLQTALLELPERITGLEFAHEYRSATEMARVGGDFYDLFELDEGLVGILVGDISGKGINAAVLTSLTKDCIRTKASEKGMTPADALHTANEVLLRWSPPEVFATVFFAMLDPVAGRLAFSNGGHPSGVMLVADTGVARVLSANSPLVGAFASSRFVDTEVPMRPGDLLALYTDGLTEARRNGELLGEERVFDVVGGSVGSSPAEVVRRMMDAALGFTGGTLSDDLALLVLRREG